MKVKAKRSAAQTTPPFNWSATGRPLNWGATEAEVAGSYPSDGLLAPPIIELHRAISVSGSRSHLFRWLCQLKAAPYSYDLLNNLGRRSPRTLTPGLERLEVGQRFITVFALLSFAVDDHITIKVNRMGRLLFGELMISYVVRDDIFGGTRLVVKLTLPRARRLGLLRQWFLGWLDLFMMRRQLLNLRRLAEGNR